MTWGRYLAEPQLDSWFCMDPCGDRGLFSIFRRYCAIFGIRAEGFPVPLFHVSLRAPGGLENGCNVFKTGGWWLRILHHQCVDGERLTRFAKLGL